MIITEEIKKCQFCKRANDMRLLCKKKISHPEEYCFWI